MKAIPIEKIKKIAKQASFALTGEEQRLFGKQMANILDFVSRVNQKVSVHDIPLINVTGRKNVFRDDKTESSLSLDQALKNTQSRQRGYFKTKSVFDEK